jgi:hypothetical protein
MVFKKVDFIEVESAKVVPREAGDGRGEERMGRELELDRRNKSGFSIAQ